MDFSFLAHTPELTRKAKKMALVVPAEMFACGWHRQQARDDSHKFFSGYMLCQCELCLVIRSYLVWRAYKE